MNEKLSYYEIVEKMYELCNEISDTLTYYEEGNYAEYYDEHGLKPNKKIFKKSVKNLVKFVKKINL